MMSNKCMKFKTKNIYHNISSNVEYAGFHSRAIASIIDLALMAIAFLPLFSLFDNIIFGNIQPSAVLDNASKEMLELVRSGKNIGFMEFITTNPKLKEYFITEHGLIKALLNQVLKLGILASVFLCFWFKKQATPGKLCLSLKIVDAETLGKPTKKQLIIRMFSYLISITPLLLGIIWISFDPKKQAWHDKIASTLVIKDNSVTKNNK